MQSLSKTLGKKKKYKNPSTVCKNISKLEWKFDDYGKQSWGNHIHKIAPYVGRIKPSFAHFLIKYVSKKGETILDPFCGIGTIPTEAALMGRPAIGNDLNPYAICISNAKKDNKKKLKDLIKYIENIDIKRDEIDLSVIPDWIREYYNQDTLKEILYTVDFLKQEKEDFLLGCLVAISQGHRPGHLSKPCAWTLPYKPRPDDLGEYRELKPRLIEKVKRTYKYSFSKMSPLTVHFNDARKLLVEDNSVDHIITSPPYYNTLDYVTSHRLRLAIFGMYDEEEKKSLKSDLIQHFKSYIEDIEIVIKELSRVLKPGGFCVFVVGDHFKGKLIINTAEELTPVFLRNGFSLHGIVDDKIPPNKSVQKSTKNEKYERIMVLTKN